GARAGNAGRRLISKPVALRVDSTATAWTSGYREGELITAVLKSGEGAYVASAPVLAALAAGDGGQVVLRYAGANQNGSADAIAGVANAAGNVGGRMAHPQHAIDKVPGARADGVVFFTSVLRTLAAA